jgi:hypothetical protein
MDDRIVSNSELLDLLEQRETAKVGAANYRAKDKDAKEAIIKLGEEPPYRIGRFIITKRSHNGRHVEFDTEAGSTINIARADE